MFGFFDKLPKEITLEILKKLSLGNQARFARVCKKTNELANNENLGLFKFKSGVHSCQIGDISVSIGKEEAKEHVSYDLRIIKKGISKDYGVLINNKNHANLIIEGIQKKDFKLITNILSLLKLTVAERFLKEELEKKSLQGDFKINR